MSEANLWQMQHQLYGSPYSGCRCFTGWPKPAPGPKVNNTCWPSPYNAPGAILCHDQVSRQQPGCQNVQRAHFRPSAPYPSWVLGPGGDPVKPMPCIVRPGPAQPPYNIAKGIRGPSTMGPLTYGIAGGLTHAGQDFVVGNSGQASTHNLGHS